MALQQLPDGWFIRRGVPTTTPPGDPGAVVPANPPNDWAITGYNSGPGREGGKFAFKVSKNGVSKTKNVKVTLPEGDARLNFPRHWKIGNFFNGLRSTPEGIDQLWDMKARDLERLLDEQDDPDLHVDRGRWDAVLSVAVLRAAAERRITPPVEVPAPPGEAPSFLERISNVVTRPLEWLNARYEERFGGHFQRQARALMDRDGTHEAVLAVVREMAPDLGGDEAGINLADELGAALPPDTDMESVCIFLSTAGAGNAVSSTIGAVGEAVAALSIKSMMLHVAFETIVADDALEWHRDRVAVLVEAILGDDGQLWYVQHPAGAVLEGNHFTAVPIDRADIREECNGSHTSADWGVLYNRYDCVRREAD